MSAPLTTSDYNLPVQTIRVTVHTTGKFFEADTRSGNHASIYLLTGEGKSVHLNMIKAGPVDTMGTYSQERCSYDKSRSSVHDIDLRPIEGLTVGHVIRLIMTKGRSKYRLTPSGVGCRFWVKTVIDDLDTAKYIHPSSPANAAKVHDDLQYNYSRGKGPEFEAIVPGRFV